MMTMSYHKTMHPAITVMLLRIFIRIYSRRRYSFCIRGGSKFFY